MRELTFDEFEAVFGGEATATGMMQAGGAVGSVAGTVVTTGAMLGYFGGTTAIATIGLSNPLGWALLGGFAVGAGLYCLFAN